MIKGRLGLILILLACLLAIASFAGARLILTARAASGPSSPERTGEPAPLAVTVATATTRTFRDQLFLSGTLVAREEAQVGVQIDGLRIAEIRAEDGDRVEAGQVLARLDRSQLEAVAAQNEAAIARAEASIAQAQAQVEQFEATVAQANADYQRGRQLGLGVITQATLDQRLATSKSVAAQLAGAGSALVAARADLASQKAQLRELQVRLDRTDVRAPVAGIVSRRSARVGQLAMGSGEPLFRLIKDAAIDLDAEAPDEALAKIRTGMEASVTLATDDPPLAGSVRLISSEVDRATRLGHVRIALPAVAPGRIGGFATAVVTVLSRDGVAVPASAVTRGERGRVVQVVRDGRVELRPIEVGLASRDLVEITQGLRPGERVVARAAAFLRGGDLVREIAAATGEAGR